MDSLYEGKVDSQRAFVLSFVVTLTGAIGFTGSYIALCLTFNWMAVYLCFYFMLIFAIGARKLRQAIEAREAINYIGAHYGR